MKKAYLLALVICLALLAGCNEKKDRVVLLADMVVFDRAYIPALALTNEADAARAQTAVMLLRSQWELFKQAHYRQDGTKSAEWQAVFDEMDRRIVAADDATRNGNLPLAHTELEGVRTTLLQARRSNKIEYYLDYFTAFHTPMEAIVQATKGQTPATLSDAELAQIGQDLATARARWEELVQAEYDAPLFDLSAEKSAMLWTEMERESAALKELSAALQRGDQAAVLQTAPEIRTHFATAYRLFGDFDRVNN